MTTHYQDYRRRLQLVADRYVRLIAPDDGFGLTETQGTSLVNTCEALTVLRAAAVKRQLRVDLDVVCRALGYLTVNLPAHCAPRTAAGGRGQKARFVSFALAGLAEWPDELTDPALKTIRWGIEWLGNHRVTGGIPEEAGVPDASLFQNAMAISALCKLLRLPLGDTEVARCADLIRQLVADSLYFALPNCTWPRQTYQARTSPSKTALLVIALHEARLAGCVPDHVAFAGVSEEARLPFDQFLTNGAHWLVHHVRDWRRLIEADPDVTGTQWHHLGYALCIEALVCAGVPLMATVVGPWRDLFALWDRERSSWCEPTTPRLATIRADYVTVRAIEALLDRYGTHGFTALQALVDAAPDAEAGSLGTLIMSPLGRFAIEPDGRGPRRPLELTPAQESLLKILVDCTSHEDSDEPAYVSADQFASLLGRSRSSIGQFVRRLNAAAAEQTGSDKPLVVSRRTRGYRLNVDAVRIAAL